MGSSVWGSIRESTKVFLLPILFTKRRIQSVINHTTCTPSTKKASIVVYKSSYLRPFWVDHPPCYIIHVTTHFLPYVRCQARSEVSFIALVV